MPGPTKRQKEKRREEKRREKEARRDERRRSATPREKAEGEDPDIAGIVPGPQPRLEGFEDLDQPGEEESPDDSAEE